ncbi:dihydrouridine synthase [Thozetella sp. PMI_491]|nr:dihydrouridine synthase [Thozetella sp. PMI_491]
MENLRCETEEQGPQNAEPPKRSISVVEIKGEDTQVADNDEHTAKRLKSDDGVCEEKPRDRVKGVAPIKKEYLVSAEEVASAADKPAAIDDDAAEAGAGMGSHGEQKDSRKGGRRKKQKGGQNKERDFGRFTDSIRLCNSRVWAPELSPKECKLGDRCSLLHDLRKYLKEGRREDLDTMGGKCPVWESYGRCPSGWRCRFVSSHMEEIEREDGRKELVLTTDPSKDPRFGEAEVEARPGVVNIVLSRQKFDMEKKKFDFSMSEKYIEWLNKDMDIYAKNFAPKVPEDQRRDYRAEYVEPPFKPSEKRRLYFGRETPVLAPLTTQGNLPFRRLCVELGAQATYSEMALGMPLLQGNSSDWTLMRAHEAEVTPPRLSPTSSSSSVVQGYENARDLKFGVQIAAYSPWLAVKTAQAITSLLPHVRVIDLNCGCPIDMIVNSGAGSSLLESHTKLERMVRGMNTVSGEVPISVKIRMGVRDDKLTANKVIERMAFGNPEVADLTGPPGCAAVTLHGRTRQQRYTKSANWGYIAECAALIKSYNEKKDELADTAREPDEAAQANGGNMFFLGNGDCYSHVDYFDHLDKAKVDSVMIGRGAIVKPWIFEEIEKGQYLDKSATERLGYVEKFVRYGLESWGSDELGLGLTRRFLLEFLSFFHRYVPLGVLEYLPPTLNDRPPRYRGRNELETLLASEHYKDWVKISEMFLGPAHPDFKFQPKHKSNSYEIDAEG